MRQNAGTFATALERANNVQQVSIITLFGWRCTKMFEAFVRVVERIDTGTPAFVTEWRIGNHVVKGLNLTVVTGKERIRQRVALLDQRRGVVVQNHVHPRQTGGGRVLLLAIERDLGAGFITHFQQQ
jgi:hypothetical protein